MKARPPLCDLLCLRGFFFLCTALSVTEDGHPPDCAVPHFPANSDSDGAADTLIRQRFADFAACAVRLSACLRSAAGNLPAE